MDKPYAIKSNNFDSDITRYRDCCFEEGLSWCGDFQQNANKVDFVLKDIVIPLLKIFINIFFIMQNEKVTS